MSSLVRVTQMDSVWNEEVQRRTGISWSRTGVIDHQSVRCVEHMERMDECLMATTVSMERLKQMGNGSDVDLALVGLNGVKVALRCRGVTRSCAREEVWGA